MKFRYYRLNIDFDLYRDKFNMLIIENPNEFEKIVIALYDRLNKRDFDIELFDKNEKEEICKKVEMFLSPLDFKYDKKEIQKRLFTELIEDIRCSENSEEFSEVCSKFLELLDELKISTDYDLDFEENFELGVLLKSLDVHLKEPEGRFIEKFIEYSSNTQRLLGREIFIFISCMKYMNARDIEFLKKHAEYKGLTILFIENMQWDLKFDVNEYIIDGDLCELY